MTDDPAVTAAARAIYEAHNPVYDVTISTEGVVSGPTRCTWDNAGDVHRDLCLGLARRAILAYITAASTELPRLILLRAAVGVYLDTHEPPYIEADSEHAFLEMAEAYRALVAAD